MYCRLIAPKWLEETGVKRILEGEMTPEEIEKHNLSGYNVYYLPNHPGTYDFKPPVSGSHINVFEYVFVDMDLKEGKYSSKDEFLQALVDFPVMPSKVVDSGNGIHAYWKVLDLNAKSYLRLSRRLMRALRTDEAVGQIFQLLRLPDTFNTKQKDNYLKCEILAEIDQSYTCEEIHNALPPLTKIDEDYCERHFNMTYSVDSAPVVSEKMPVKWGELVRRSAEARDLFLNQLQSGDRSKDDWRLGHILYANGFTKEEAVIVLSQTAKAIQRSPQHQYNYAQNIVDKIFTFESTGVIDEEDLSNNITEILKRDPTAGVGTRFPCHKRIDDTVHGFRLGQVIGLVAGSGVGKTSFALNMFRWFIEENPDYHHFFVPLEQPAEEIAARWNTVSGGDTRLNDRVHVVSNYTKKGVFRNLSLDDIKNYILKFQEKQGVKVGCVVIDHIGALKKKSTIGENQDLTSISHQMKSFAIETKTLLVMQSQTSRAKAGIGDIELNKDAAYGTMYFEAYCDYVITLWQPLKRCHNAEACPTVTAFKFCKIRHKKAKQDGIKEDIPYYFYFDSDEEKLRDMTEQEKVSFKYFLQKATQKRNSDVQTGLTEYQAVPYNGGLSGKADSSRQLRTH